MAFPSVNIHAFEKIVLDKCNSFINMGIWPNGNVINPRKWLENFRESEKEHALYLLDSFIYFNIPICMAIHKANIIQLSLEIDQLEDRERLNIKFSQLLNKTIFVAAKGESANATDSGIMFCGYMRRLLKISELQFLKIEDIYSKAYEEILKKMDRIIFIDDFIGTGHQFRSMYNEDFELDTDFKIPIKERLRNLGLKPYFSIVLTTEDGAIKAKDGNPELTLLFGDLIPKEQNAFNNKSLIWPERLKDSSESFLNETSLRAGIPEQLKKGYGNLGLNIAFELTIPDSTIPLFSWSENNWKPLMKKT